MTKKAIFFDCDGTLLNTLEDIHDALNLTLLELGIPEATIVQTKSYVGNGLHNLMRNALGQVNVDEALMIFHRHYSAGLINKTFPYEGILALIDDLKASGLIVGMISNKTDSYIQRIAQHFFNTKLDVVIGERDGCLRKPDVAMMTMACEQVNVALDEVIFIGDSLVDAQFITTCNVVGGLFTHGFEAKADLMKTGLPCFENVAQCREWLSSHISH